MADTNLTDPIGASLFLTLVHRVITGLTWGPGAKKIAVGHRLTPHISHRLCISLSSLSSHQEQTAYDAVPNYCTLSVLTTSQTHTKIRKIRNYPNYQKPTDTEAAVAFSY